MITSQRPNLISSSLFWIVIPFYRSGLHSFPTCVRRVVMCTYRSRHSDLDTLETTKRMLETPELIAICYDEKHMCSHLHSDTTGRVHPENPSRLEAIIKRLSSETISFDDYGEHRLLEFTRLYSCHPVDRSILYYCHSKNQVKQLVKCCRDIAILNDEYDSYDREEGVKEPFLSGYPLDQDTYLTSKSELVARLAVGGIVRLVNVLMKRDVGDVSSLPITRSSRSLSNLSLLTEGLEDLETELSDSEQDRTAEVPADDSGLKVVDLSGLKISTEEPYARIYAVRSDLGERVYKEKSGVARPFSLDSLTKAFRDLGVTGDKPVEGPPDSVRKGFALLRPPGHHATREKMMGFCLYNNVAIAAAHLQKTLGLKRIAIVDIDVHHGNGTQDIFYNNSGVCFISIHRFGTDKNPFYPHTGNVNETGGPNAQGSNVNIPLSAGYTTHDFVYAAEHVVLPKLESFKPEFILVSCGFDAAQHDYLGGCEVTPDGYSWLVLELCKVAERHSKGRLLLALEGGYNPRVNADCTEAIFRTIMSYEMDRSYKVKCTYKHSKVRKSTKAVCFELKKFNKKAQPVPIPSISSSSSIYDEYNATVSLRWERYKERLEADSFVLAGGHLSQFILPSGPNRQELCKLCSPRELEFYAWLWAINGKTIEVIEKRYPYLTLPFSNEEANVYITGIRLITDPSIAPKVKANDSYNFDMENLPKVEGDLEAVKQLINFVMECTGIYTREVFAEWKLENSHTLGIRLRNALCDMNEPCVMDIKMGTRLYGDDLVDPKEIEKKELKASRRSSKSHGFHICGMFRWVQRKRKAAFLPENIAYGLKTDDDLVSAFALYFNRIPYKEVAFGVIDKLIDKLTKLRTLFETQKHLALYCSSLLFVFDSHTKKREDILKSADVHMIDLSHVSYNTGRVDSGYLLGLRTLILLLQETKKGIKQRKKFLVF